MPRRSGPDRGAARRRRRSGRTTRCRHRPARHHQPAPRGGYAMSCILLAKSRPEVRGGNGSPSLRYAVTAPIDQARSATDIAVVLVGPLDDLGVSRAVFHIFDIFGRRAAGFVFARERNALLTAAAVGNSLRTSSSSAISVTPVGKRFKNAPRFPVEKSYSARMASGFRFGCARSFLCIFIRSPLCSGCRRSSSCEWSGSPTNAAEGRRRPSRLRRTRPSAGAHWRVPSLHPIRTALSRHDDSDAACIR